MGNDVTAINVLLSENIFKEIWKAADLFLTCILFRIDTHCNLNGEFSLQENFFKEFDVNEIKGSL